MFRFLLHKLPEVLLVTIASSLIAFLLPRFAPGDPAITVAGPDATPEQLAAVREQMGLNKPLVQQYFDWVAGVVQGHFGNSFIMHRPVGQVIAARMESTLELAVLATILMLIIGFTLGVFAGMERSRFARSLLDVITTVLLATPPFLTGLILILLLGIAVPILPVSGEVGLLKDPVRGLQFLILPSFALALPHAAVIARLLSTAMQNTRAEDFIDLAKAKGVPQGRITRRHILRNSLGSAIIAAGLRIGELLAGAIVMEAIFARNGLGSLAVYSIQSRDYNILQVLILAAVLIAVAIQLLSEIILAALDPRIRLGG
ncbi:ABC transporter permease [Rhizobium binxianense]